MHNFQTSIVVLSGTSFAGKSAIGQRLAGKSNLVLLDVDIARREIQTDTTFRSQEEERAMMMQAYSRNHEKARQLIGTGVPVLLAATYSRPEYHDAVRALAGEMDVPLKVFRLKVSEQAVPIRIASRNKEGSASNVTSMDRFLEQAKRFIPMTGEDVTEVNADNSVDQVEGEILNVLSELSL